jgi:uncharacterized protein (DUF924 family)
MTSEDIIKFWFEELETSQWYKKDENLDNEMRERFMQVHSQATVGELFLWRKTPTGRLAEIIVLDQFSRNMFRGDPRSFSSDPLALVLAQEAVSIGADQELTDTQKSFLYMPYMHSESQVIHEESVRLFTEAGLKDNLDFEFKHKVIIDRFGRYPHRNEVLGRTSTPEEIEFLKGPHSSF